MRIQSYSQATKDKTDESVDNNTTTDRSEREREKKLIGQRDREKWKEGEEGGDGRLEERWKNRYTIIWFVMIIVLEHPQ